MPLSALLLARPPCTRGERTLRPLHVLCFVCPEAPARVHHHHVSCIMLSGCRNGARWSASCRCRRRTAVRRARGRSALRLNCGHSRRGCSCLERNLLGSSIISFGISPRRRFRHRRGCRNRARCVRRFHADRRAGRSGQIFRSLKSIPPSEQNASRPCSEWCRYWCAMHARRAATFPGGLGAPPRPGGAPLAIW